jgi:transposase/transposase IS116/IS110/IS902 family protein
VETLVERGCHVYALNPKQLDRFRDRFTVAGAKDDRRDAFVLAASLRTDRPAFRRVRLDDPLIIELREYSRMDDDLRDELARLANRLRRAHSGIAPVTRQSGKRRQVVMRHACNGRLRGAVYHWAFISMQHDEHSAAAYAEYRGRGHTHGRALRGVADRLLRTLIAMLKSRTLYDPQLTRRHSIPSRPSRPLLRPRPRHETASERYLDKGWGVPS